MQPFSSNSPEQYPGYPTQRFTLDTSELSLLQGLEVPIGPWTHGTPTPPPPEQTLSFIQQGYETDSTGRPLHPWARTLLQPELGGVTTGKGAYWNWGPNTTADPIVITKESRPRILLIERNDIGALALPGGFIDGDEPAHTAAIRELQEETGLVLDIEGELVYQGPVADIRATLHAWPETTAFLFTVDSPLPVEGSDDARSANWYHIDELSDKLFGSHRELIEKALESATLQPRSIRDILSIPETNRQTTHIDAGHMAYRHYVTGYENDRLFVKEHDAAQFSDPRRELHSRAYLTKEHTVYAHLAMQGFTAIPQRFDIINDSLLAMDHLAQEDGWQWRAPKEQADTYVRDILTALDKLQYTKPLDSPEYHQLIAPAYETFWREGWDAITDEVAEKIADKIQTISQNWNEPQKLSADTLLSMFDSLRSEAKTLSRTPELFSAHNDARQSNVAWHPDHGVKLVDWSWADLAPYNADATMFLIDMAKSGFNAASYLERINRDYALVLIGFWLAHSIWETRDGSTTVREHQVASATSALSLL